MYVSKTAVASMHAGSFYPVDRSRQSAARRNKCKNTLARGDPNFGKTAPHQQFDWWTVGNRGNHAVAAAVVPVLRWIAGAINRSKLIQDFSGNSSRKSHTFLAFVPSLPLSSASARATFSSTGLIGIGDQSPCDFKVDQRGKASRFLVKKRLIGLEDVPVHHRFL
jgi:hypothetical protein